MFRDREEALEQLEQQLLEEDEEYEEEEECEEEEEFEEEYQEEDDLPPEIYESYAANCRAYNSDTTDTDLDRYSEEVQQGADRKTGWLAVGMLILTVLILAIAAYFVAKQGGYLPWKP